MSEEQPARIGFRVAELRKIHGATQRALALRASVSYSLLRKVERGAPGRGSGTSRARPGQEEANFYGTKFGIPNVDSHRVAIPVELADGTTAINRATSIRLPSDTAPSRAGHYWIDLSCGWLLHGNRARALESLHTARRIAPQLTRYHPQVHETVHALAARDIRSTGSLAHFAAWCGIRR